MDEYILSKYNVFKIINDSAIGVNLYNKMLFALDKEKYNTLIKNSHNLKKLKIHDPVFFSTMSKLGIIQRIDSESTLNKKILLENRLIVFKDKSYRLTINPTLNCNFSCWYCYEAHPKKRMSKNVINATIKYIEHLVNNLKINNLNLDWFGGEPLLCYKTTMYPLANEAKKVCDQNHVSFQSGMTTNGYLIRPEMIPFFKKVNMNSFQITLDGEKDQHDKTRCCKNGKPSYDKIVQNIILLASELSLDNLAVRINYTKKFH
jgi:uncharacterized protein